jgi:hypothetical protein
MPTPSPAAVAAPTPQARKLLAELFAEAARAAPVPAAALPNGATLLQPIGTGAEWRHFAVGAHRVLTMSANGQDHFRLQTPFVPGEHEPAGRWYGWAVRLDDQGQRWERRVLAVVDNFGDLVEVSE